MLHFTVLSKDDYLDKFYEGHDVLCIPLISGNLGNLNNKVGNKSS